MENDELTKRLEALEKTSREALQYARETFYAAVFNNTVEGSGWLKDRSFSPCGWAAGYQYLYVMYRILNEFRPKCILDLGLGQTSKMIAQYAAANPDVRHVIVEASQEWIDFYRRANPLPPNSRIVKLGYSMKKAPGSKDPVRCFKLFKRAMGSLEFDFVSVDAPYAGDMKALARVDILSLIPGGIAPSYAIMVDDTNRKPELASVRLLVEKLQEAGYTASAGRYTALNHCHVIVSDDNRYLKTL